MNSIEKEGVQSLNFIWKKKRRGGSSVNFNKTVEEDLFTDVHY